MKGYGEFGWMFIPKREKVCRTCRIELKKIGSVGEVGTLYPSNERYLICNDCVRVRSEAAIQNPRS